MRDSPHQPTTTTAAEERPQIALSTTVAASMAGKQAAIDALLERVRAQAVLNKWAIMKNGAWDALWKQLSRPRPAASPVTSTFRWLDAPLSIADAG